MTKYQRVNEYLKYLKEIKNKSNNTIKNYEVDLKMFLNFIEQNKNCIITDEIIQQIKLNDIHEFIYYLSEIKNNSINTKLRRMSSIKNFFEYLQNIRDDFDLKEDPTKKLERPKQIKREPVFLTKEEVKQFLNVINNTYTFHQKRDKLIVILFLNCGLRVSELVNLKVEDFLEDGRIRILGKGNKERFIYANNIVLETLQAYLKSESIISSKIFKITSQQVEKLIKGYIKEAGIKKNVTPHKLRHTYATLLLKQSKNIRLVQENLGHSNIATTQIYTHVLEEDKKECANKFEIR